ncbi:hypothetical protein K1719_021892 [Acacia pycnantha]|nr:hypothetical protein K1719_021892 [Acacia pycnantha]
MIRILLVSMFYHGYTDGMALPKTKKDHNSQSKLINHSSHYHQRHYAPHDLQLHHETPSRSKRSVLDNSSSRLAKSSSSSHKITSLKDRIAHSSPATASVPSNVQPQAGTYTKEALLKEVPNRFEDEQDELKEKEADFFRSAKDDALDKLASIGLTNGKKSSGSLFPDEETIKAIRY